MKKKPNIKPTEEDLKDWQSFIENINSIEDKDAPLDNLIKKKIMIDYLIFEKIFMVLKCTKL